jgi:phosphomannomutase
VTSFSVAERKDLSEAPYADIITFHEQQLTQGRILVRYSGTEPVVRVMVEDSNAEVAQKTMHALCASLQKAFDL